MRGHYPYGRGGQCGAGRASMGIEANGAIKGCPLTPHGRVHGREHPRRNAQRHLGTPSAPSASARDRTPRRSLGVPGKGCNYAEHCMAGCMWTSHMYFGRPGNNPFCHHRAIEMQRSGKRERVERVRAAPGEPFDHGLFNIVLEDVETSR